LLWAAGAMIAVAFVCQGVAMAQGVPQGYAAASDPQFTAAGDPAAGGTPAITPAPAPVSGPPAAAGFQGPVNQDAVNAMVDRRLKEIEEAKKQEAEQKKQAADEQGYVVGSDLSVQTNFRNGMFLWFATPNNDFTMHLGAWMQLDNVFWDQTPILKTAQGARAGPGPNYVSGDYLGGIGDLQDGIFFRRIRPFAEGTFYETGEYRLIPALENNQYNTCGLDEFWVGETQVPIIGTIRAGHVKSPMGLEGDMTASSRCMTFMERSSYSQAIELDQNFDTGLWMSNNYFDQRATWSFAFFRPDPSASTGYSFGDTQWGWQGRLTALPIYDDDGRSLVHVGLSGGFRSGTATPGALNTITGLTCRSEMRDDVPAKDATNGDSNNMLSTGAIASNSDYLMGLEFLGIRGPLSFQAEYGWDFVEDAVGITSAGTPKITPPQNYVFSGGYVQLAYTLTGENRAYDKRLGTLAREYFGKEGPNSKFFIVRDRNGNVISSWGAWEVALRYSHVDLNDGTGVNRIQGGEMDGLSLALNWYLNNNLKLMLDWVHDDRYSLPAGSYPGITNGLGTELQLEF
jgi:phosphate-selective porin OprO/OprP